MNARARRAAFAAGMAALLVAAGASVAAAGRTPELKRQVLQRQHLRAPGQEGLMVLVEIPPGGREGRHSHPGEVFVYVLAGAVRYESEGKAPARYQAGDSMFIEPGRVHEVINDGGVPARALAVFVTDRDRPLSTPAP